MDNFVNADQYFQSELVKELYRRYEYLAYEDIEVGQEISISWGLTQDKHQQNQLNFYNEVDSILNDLELDQESIESLSSIEKTIDDLIEYEQAYIAEKFNFKSLFGDNNTLMTKKINPMTPIQLKPKNPLNFNKYVLANNMATYAVFFDTFLALYEILHDEECEHWDRVNVLKKMQSTFVTMQRFNEFNHEVIKQIS